MPITNRFSTTTNGALAITGNTLGLSKISNQNRAGTIGAIGAFATTNTALQVPTFPAGTTLNYTQNSSTAILNIPAGSTILYAEPVWGGNYLSRDQNITSVLGNPVSLQHLFQHTRLLLQLLRLQIKHLFQTLLHLAFTLVQQT